MKHLPVAAVTGRALWFEIANAFTLFRLTWLPLFVLIATEWAIAFGLVWQVPAGTTMEAMSDETSFTFASLASLLLEGLALSVVAVRVHRIILFNDRRPGEYFAFPFGKTELLYVLMGALTFAFLVALIGSVIFGIEMLSVGLSGKSAPDLFDPDFATSGAGKALLILAMVVSYVLVLWLSLRLTVWPPAVVANNRLSLGEAWRLSRGNAFALFGLMLISSFVIVVPTAAVAYWVSTLSHKTFDFFAAMPFAPFDDKVKFAVGHAGQLPNPNVLLVEFGLLFFYTTYTVAILSYTYKALKGFDAQAPIDQQDTEADDAPSSLTPMGAL